MGFVQSSMVSRGLMGLYTVFSGFGKCPKDHRTTQYQNQGFEPPCYAAEKILMLMDVHRVSWVLFLRCKDWGPTSSS